MRIRKATSLVELSKPAHPIRITVLPVHTVILKEDYLKPPYLVCFTVSVWTQLITRCQRLYLSCLRLSAMPSLHSGYALAIVTLDAHNDPGRRVLDHLKAVQQQLSKKNIVITALWIIAW